MRPCVFKPIKAADASSARCICKARESILLPLRTLESNFLVVFLNKVYFVASVVIEWIFYGC